MATNGDDAISAIAARLRDAGSTAHSRDLIQRILTHSQRAINYAQKVRVSTVSFTPSPGRTLYETSEVAADVARIDRVIANGRALPEIMWQQLISDSRTWYRNLAPRHYAFARVGGNLFVLTPAQVVPVPVSVVYTTVPADVDDAATPIDLPDEWVPMLLDLTEGIMLFRARLYAAMDGPMARVASQLELKPPRGVAKVNS